MSSKTAATGSRATVAAERTGKFQAEYVPPPPPPQGKFIVRAPVDGHGRPACADLHLSVDMAEDLRDELHRALQAYMENTGG